MYVRRCVESGSSGSDPDRGERQSVERRKERSVPRQAKGASRGCDDKVCERPRDNTVEGDGVGAYGEVSEGDFLATIRSVMDAHGRIAQMGANDFGLIEGRVLWSEVVCDESLCVELCVGSVHECIGKWVLFSLDCESVSGADIVREVVKGITALCDERNEIKSYSKLIDRKRYYLTPSCNPNIVVRNGIRYVMLGERSPGDVEFL